MSNRLLIFNYHRIDRYFDPALHRPGAWCHLDTFTEHLQAITEYLPVVPLHATLRRLKAGEAIGECAAITIDDGDRSTLAHAAPLLKRLNCPATLFVNSIYLRPTEQLHFGQVLRYLRHMPGAGHHLRGKTDAEWDALRQTLRATTDPQIYQQREQIERLAVHIPNRQQWFVDNDALAELDPELIQVGLHGHEHQRFAMLSHDQQRQALVENINALQDMPHYVPLFAPPFGKSRDWNGDTVTLCAELGLTMLASGRGRNIRPALMYSRRGADQLTPDSLRRLLPLLTR